MVSSNTVCASVWFCFPQLGKEHLSFYLEGSEAAFRARVLDGLHLPLHNQHSVAQGMVSKCPPPPWNPGLTLLISGSGRNLIPASLPSHSIKLNHAQPHRQHYFWPWALLLFRRGWLWLKYEKRRKLLLKGHMSPILLFIYCGFLLCTSNWRTHVAMHKSAFTPLGLENVFQFLYVHVNYSETEQGKFHFYLEIPYWESQPS